uniref:DUF2946 domain-containing protein n=1 Tax=Rhodopseudomonas palustris (strain BisA53) TaxID=316055 RepID=Q07PU6_RHOP5
MRGGFHGLRSVAVRAVVLWMVSFGLLFQALLPAIGLPSTPQAQTLAALCVAHADQAPANSSDDPHSALCLSVCALIHAAQFFVAPVVSPAIVALSTRWQRIDLASNDRLILVRTATPYSSRAPPTI